MKFDGPLKNESLGMALPLTIRPFAPADQDALETL
jgi:hypothetical protein